VTDLEFSWIIKSFLWTLQRHRKYEMQSGTDQLKVADLLIELRQLSMKHLLRESPWNLPMNVRNAWEIFQKQANHYQKVVNILRNQLQGLFGIQHLGDFVLAYTISFDWPYELLVWIGWLDPQK